MVTELDRQVLESMAHRARTAPQLGRRARIVLACATGLDNMRVAKKLRMAQPTVGGASGSSIRASTGCWTSRGRARLGRSTIPQVEDVVTRTLEGTPRGATHWSTRTLAKPNQQRLGPYLRQLRPGVLAG